MVGRATMVVHWHEYASGIEKQLGQLRKDLAPCVRKKKLGELRSTGVRDLFAFGQDYRCGHRVKLSAMVVDEWPDDIRLS
ncbi:hypothetical protein [Bradyrhizobium sp. BR 1432]|uniref:hypothetical protein n=1 Tax=Bradyrhizobium sp. BR 1432 TaxID=3447966 RepID=UPI003EE5290C